jgi:hypothetical protein
MNNTIDLNSNKTPTFHYLNWNKKIFLTLLIVIMTSISSNADYTSSGTADSKGQAYIEAMSNTPSGSHWVVKSVNYSFGYLNRYVCTIVWKEK